MKRINLIVIFLVIFLFGCNKKNDSPYIRKGNKIYYGYYPQSLEKNKNRINKLNKKAGELPTESNPNNWTSYNYYILDNVENYMWYIDIDLNNDNRFDYRGIYFIKYRPHYTNLSEDPTYSIQLHNEYYINTTYWFKYEQIEWDILEEDNGRATIISNLIIDSKDYYPSQSRDELEHNGGIGYTNNYELSNIRKWLNDDFYNTAFNTLEKELINKTLVDNSGDEYVDIYASNDTLDNIYLLSKNEAMNYYKTTNDRQVGGTDYAKAQGLNSITDNQCMWLFRSPYSSNPNYILLVSLDGSIIHSETNSTFTGIRPVININL